jgi:deoxyribonuclease V
MHRLNAPGRRIPVIGAAKPRYRGTPGMSAVFSERSARPLDVTAAGMPEDPAGKRIRAMHGDHRRPSLLQHADRLCRQADSSAQL